MFALYCIIRAHVVMERGHLLEQSSSIKIEKSIVGFNEFANSPSTKYRLFPDAL